MKRAITAAASLLSDGDNDNNEYDRALVEMIGTMLAIDLSTEDARDAVLAMLRGMNL